MELMRTNVPLRNNAVHLSIDVVDILDAELAVSPVDAWRGERNRLDSEFGRNNVRNSPT
jgi:hypothetical protein